MKEKKMLYNFCQRCRRALKNPKYMAAGFGPVCAAKVKRDEQPQLPFDCFLHEEAGNPDVILRRRPDSNGGWGDALTNIQHRKVLHSPTGFEWGYAGSGPADLALNILLRYGVTEAQAENLHQRFKDAFIATMPREGGRITRNEVIEWIESQINY